VFAVLFVVLDIGWYLYTAAGSKLLLLVVTFREVLSRLASLTLLGKGTEKLTEEYGSLWIDISRKLYIVIALLVALGLGIVLLRRVLSDRSVVSDEYLALSTGFALMVVPILFSPAFNLSRLVMIVLVFNSIFILYGLNYATGVLGRGLGAVGSRFRKGSFQGKPVNVVVALCLFCMLVLNSGVAAEVTADDYAPSNVVVSDERLQDSENLYSQLNAVGCLECTTSSGIWLVNYMNPDRAVLRDRQADRLGGVLASRSDAFFDRPHGLDTRDKRAWITYERERLAGSYLVITTRNTRTGQVFASRYRGIPLSEANTSLGRARKVFTTGHNAIYIP
jgi:uncharacterized membrane protein